MQVLTTIIKHMPVESKCFHKSYVCKTKLKAKSLRSESKDNLRLTGPLEEKYTDIYFTQKHLSRS